ncbi:MAG: ABC transporter permease [Oscillibacter sp.]|nr:ABC transporter permease [Oscillibacter sp.]
MYRYVMKRILFLIPTILGVIFIIYFVLNLTPGNPGRSILGVSAPQEAVDQLNEELGYNDPLIVKYYKYIKSLVVDHSFGTSYFTKQSVMDEVLPRFWVTLKLAIIGIVISTLIGVPLGILTAVKQYSVWDYLPSMIAFLLAAVPAFVLGMALLLIFSLKLNILPSYGLDSWECYIMPSLCMAIPITAFNVRFTKSSMLESIRADYIDTARAKGAKEKTVIWKHALKNALLPVVTNIGLNMGGLIMGAVVAERLFSVPGIGALIVDRINYRDEPVIIACTIVIAITFTIIMLIVDIVYAFIDPRIKAKYTRVKG